MVFFIIPIGLFTSCLRSAREREVQYVSVPTQHRVVVVNQRCVPNYGACYSAGPGCQPAAPVQAQQGGYYHPHVTYQQQPPPPYHAANAHPQQQQQYVSTGQPTQAPHQASTPQANSELPRRRRPWQRRNKDGYSYTVMES